VVGEEVFHAHGLGDGVFAHRHALTACEIILGDSGTCQFVVAADEVGGDAVEGMGNAFAVAVVEEGCAAAAVTETR
jgi:hypothetical protein